MITIEKIWLTEDAVWIRTADGKEACEFFADYPRLKFASPEQRAHYVAEPSPARLSAIYATIHSIGEELLATFCFIYLLTEML